MSEARAAASILVVDDTVENLRLLASFLGDHGYDVRPVTSGRQALQVARHDPPDLILLDITMPDMDGIETCGHFKADETLKDIPIIFLTALSETSDKVKAFDAGGADFVTKPFQIDEVLARVKVHVALRNAQRELMQSYDRLSALERLRDDLVQMVVHDMRSPLTALLAHLQFLDDARSEAFKENEQAEEDIRSAVRAARVITRMANDLLDVSRMEEGKLKLELSAYDLGEMAEQVSGNLAVWDRSRSLQVEKRGAAFAHCDSDVVQRILENMISNAIKHTPSGGRIHTVVTSVGERIRVAIHDEGPGVPDDAKAKIFDKFGTLSTRKGGKYHSAGLGLAFCKLAVEAHGGTVGVSDGAPTGSVFWFELPADASPQNVASGNGG